MGLGQVLVILAFVCGCSPAIAPYSLQAYENAVDLKVDALRLMDQAELPYSENERRIQTLQTRMEKAFEFAKGRPKNEHSTEQWRIMNDPAAHLLGGFLRRWQTEGTLSRGFIVEAERIISRGFDSIIGLGSGKVGSKNQIGK